MLLLLGICKRKILINAPKNDDNNDSIIIERYLESYGIFGIRLATANIHLLVYIKRFSLKFQLKFSVFGL